MLKTKTSVAVWVLFALFLAGCGGSRINAGPDKISVQPSSVEGMPMLWLGEEYDEDGDGKGDLPLVLSDEFVVPATRDPRTGTVLYPEIRGFQIGYGDCEIPAGAEGCPIPVSITVYARCYAEPLAPEVKEEVVAVRGVNATVYGGGAVRVDTDEFSLQVHAVGDREDPVETGKQRALKVIENLRGANDAAREYGRGTPFKPVVSAQLCRE